MTDHPSSKAGTEEARALLKSGENAMRSLLVAFDLMADEILDGKDYSEAEIKRTCLALGRAQSSLMEEIQKYERHVLREKGLIEEAPIDFDRVRREIGRRLDGIRDAQNAE